MTIRERLEEIEQQTLSPHAALSADSVGREVAEAACLVRTAYQRDRDRVIHLCRAFRRLAYKTQVFISPTEDHLHTRLSHTLEVSQVARTIAKALRLNEDLTEAIALGHDVGHTPFGHSGEAALDEAYRGYEPEGSFKHQEHSLRVVDCIERDAAGLNLTWETRQGIVQHSKGQANLAQVLDAGVLAGGSQNTLEGLVVSVADRIAYVNHDLDDCLRVGLLQPDDLPAGLVGRLGEDHSTRVGTMVEDIIAHSIDLPRLAMSTAVVEAADELKTFLFESVYEREELVEDREKVRGIIGNLFTLYMDNDDALMEACGRVPCDGSARSRLVCDYIAGMTDRFAANQYVKHFLPSSFPT